MVFSIFNIMGFFTIQSDILLGGIIQISASVCKFFCNSKHLYGQELKLVEKQIFL